MGLRLLHLSDAASRNRRRCLANSEVRLAKRFFGLAAGLVTTQMETELELCMFRPIFLLFIAALQNAKAVGPFYFGSSCSASKASRPVHVTMTSATDWDQNGKEDAKYEMLSHQVICVFARSRRPL